MNDQDTIFAPASGQGRAGICVIRLSGASCDSILETLGVLPLPLARHMSLRILRRSEDGIVLDHALVVRFPAPNSFTGEDQAELHIHGGLAVRAAVMRALSDIGGCRPAEPGEFTKRAFLNGKLDLAKVEGLADLIDAETEAQRLQALRQFDGILGKSVEVWRSQLIDVLALIESQLDFSDEGDVPLLMKAEIRQSLETIESDISSHLAQSRSGALLREGFTVVLVGPPNAGKSTLLNALAKRDIAIVSPYAGTTRDAIEVRCDLEGLPVTFIDTAGLRESQDVIERIGIDRSLKKAENADLVLWLQPMNEKAANIPSFDRPLLRIGTKSDIMSQNGSLLTFDRVVSVMTGEGLNQLIEHIVGKARKAMNTGDALLTRERHRTAFVQIVDAIQNAFIAIDGQHLDLAAEDVRHAVSVMGFVTGRIGFEDILDRVFSSFCIGK